MEWNKLSMADKANYINLGVQNKIFDLSTIRNTYNKYQEGGQKQKAYYRHVSELPEYHGTYSGGYKTATLVWVDENGTPIATRNLHNYDTSKRIKYEDRSSSTESPIYQYNEEFLSKAEKAKMDRVRAQEEDLARIREDITELAYNTPVLGDVLSAKDILLDINSGNYMSAAIGTGMLLLPNIIERPFKYIKRGVNRLLKHSRDSKIARVMDKSLKEGSLFTSLPSSTSDFKRLPKEDLMIHADRGDKTGAFTKHGAYIENEMLNPGKARKADQKDYTWFNKGVPYTLKYKEDPMTRVFIGEANDIPGITLVRDMNEPVGQWPGKRIKSKSFVKKSEYVTPKPIPISKLIQYDLDPFERAIGNQIYKKEGIPIIREYGTYNHEYRDISRTRQGYRTKGKSEHIKKLETKHYKEDITNPQNQVLSGPINDIKTIKVNSTSPKVKEIINWNKPNKGSYVINFTPEEYIKVNEGSLGKVTGEYYNDLLDPSRVIQNIKVPQLFDNKHRFMSTNPDQYFYTDYFTVPLTLWHKFGGSMYKKKKL